MEINPSERRYTAEQKESRTRIIGFQLEVVSLLAQNYPNMTESEYRLALVDLLHGSLRKTVKPGKAKVER